MTRAEATAPGLAAIRPSDLRRDLFAMAGDAMRGREAGTLDELRASMWVAEQARAAGLQPGGDDGTFFQFWPMRRVRLTENSRVALAAGGDTLRSPWATDWAPYTRADAQLDVPIVWLDGSDSATLARADVRGRAVALRMAAPSTPPPADISLRDYRYALGALGQTTARLRRLGAAAIILVGDDTAERAWSFAAPGMVRGRYLVDSAGARPTTPAAGRRCSGCGSRRPAGCAAPASD